MGFLSKLKKRASDKDQVKQDMNNVKNSENKPEAAQKKVNEIIADSKDEAKTETKETKETKPETKSDAKPAAAGAATGAATGVAATEASKPKKSSAQYLEEINERRTVYGLNKEVSLSNDEITEIIKKVVARTPSSFNSQPVRAVILYGEKHDQLWNEIAVKALKAVVREENWESTGTKLKGFAAGAGTVLFFENTESIEKMQEQFPTYAANFPIWAGHSSGATQINAWTALALEGIGANLQHYSPLIDEDVAKEFKVPEGWVLTAQLVFGGITAEPTVPEKISDAVIVA